MAQGTLPIGNEVLQELKAGKGTKGLAGALAMLYTKTRDKAVFIDQLQRYGGAQGGTIAAFLKALGSAGTSNPLYATYLNKLPLQ